MANELKLQNPLSSDRKPVKVGSDTTGLLLEDETVIVKELVVDGTATIGKLSFLEPSTVSDYLTIDIDEGTIDGGTFIALSIDYDKTGSQYAATHSATGLSIDMDDTLITDGVGTMTGIKNTPTLEPAASSGFYTIYGLNQVVTPSTNGVSTAYGILNDVKAADNITGIRNLVEAGGISCVGLSQRVEDGGIDIKLESSADSGDYFSIATTTHGATTITTVDDDAAAAHLNIEPDGHVEFDNCGVGFDLVTPTYNASITPVDFRTGNKQFVTFGAGSITNLNLTFPATSGNFVLLLKQDGTGSRTITNYKVYASDEAYASGSAAAKFAGGSNPTLTTDANHVDILSFFWDADNEIAYGVATLDFQF